MAFGIRDQFNLAASGVTRYGLPKSAIMDALLTVPPFDEQQAIASFLDDQTQKIDHIISETNKAIERLTEYRTTLISAAVTGKIDVRGRAS